MAHHEFEQLEFARSQLDFLAVAHDPAGHAVQFQIRQFQLCARFRVARFAAACKRVDARQQFGHVIGLGQIVVAAGAQPRDAVIDIAERAQDEHRHLASRGP